MGRLNWHNHVKKIMLTKNNNDAHFASNISKSNRTWICRLTEIFNKVEKGLQLTQTVCLAK